MVWCVLCTVVHGRLQPDFCFFVSTCLQNLVLKQKAVLSLCCILIVVKCCGWVIAVSGSSDGIYIYAVFVSWLSGESLLQIVGDHDTTCIIQPDFEDAAWSIMAVSFISLVAVSAVLATLFFVRRQQLQHLGTHLLSRVTSGMSATQVKSLPSIVFQGPGNGSGTAETCAICLEDYEIGEKLRLLPCNHGNVSPMPPLPSCFYQSTYLWFYMLRNAWYWYLPSAISWWSHWECYCSCSLPYSMLLKVAECVCDCHYCSNHSSVFFLCFWGFGLFLFLFTDMLLDQKSL